MRTDLRAIIKDVHLVHVYIEKQWKSSAMECKNMFCVKMGMKTYIWIIAGSDNSGIAAIQAITRTIQPEKNKLKNILLAVALLTTKCFFQIYYMVSCVIGQ